jgi:DNA-binding protein YbaB
VEVGVSSLADSLIARMVAHRDLLQEIDKRFSSISAHVASPDESVSVEVDGLGAMTGLWLGAQALELEPDALAKLIVDTASSAAGAVNERQELLIGELNERMRAVREVALTLWDGTTVEAP